jgi:RNA polymerase sigma-70 factor (ECF subfamily)
MTPSDESLVERVLKRDAHAFETLFHRYSEMICHHLTRIVRDRAAADDLVQEVFLRVWDRAEQWNGQGPFRAWLFRIATRQALNHLRSVQRRREQPLDAPRPPADEEDESLAPGDLIDASALGPDAALEEAEQRGLLRRFLDELPEEKREVFRMIHDAEMEVREIAEALRIPEGTVKSRLHHARRHLARRWRDITEEKEFYRRERGAR